MRLLRLLANRRSRLKRFSIRSLLIATGLLCVLLGCWSAYVQPYRNQAASLAQLDRLGAATSSVGADGPAWQRWLVEAFAGPEAFVEVRTADLRGIKVVGEQFETLRGLIFLESLRLDRTPLADDNVNAIGQLMRLNSLSIAYTKVTDRGFRTLASLPRLEKIYLTGVPITDASLIEMVEMPSVREFYIRWTKISDEGAERLRRQLPKCEVHHQRSRLASATR